MSDREKRETDRGSEEPEPVPQKPDEDEKDAQVDRDAAETFPASDPPAKY